MRKVFKISLVCLVFLGLNGCGSEEEKSTPTTHVRYNYAEMPKKFIIEAENFTRDYFEIGLENGNKEIILSRQITKKTKDTLVCSEYSNEETLVTYDCTITSSDNKVEEKKENIIIEKGLKYNVYSKDKKGKESDVIGAMEIFIPEN